MPDGELPSLLSNSFHDILKCKVRNRILLRFSAQYQNMSLPFDCIYSMCDSSPTMPVLTQQTDTVCAACQGAGMLDYQGRNWCYSDSGAWKIRLYCRCVCESHISSLQREQDAKIFLRLGRPLYKSGHLLDIHLFV